MLIRTQQILSQQIIKSCMDRTETTDDTRFTKVTIDKRLRLASSIKIGFRMQELLITVVVLHDIC